MIKKFHPHPFLFLGFYFGGFALMAVSLYVSKPMAWVGLAIIVLGEVTRRAETFYVTDLGVSREYKLFATSRQFAEYRRIQNVDVHQSFLERVFGIGHIHFDTSGADRIEIEFRGVPYPYSIDKIVRGKMVTSTP